MPSKTYLMVEDELHRKHRWENLKGQTFGSLTALHPAYRGNDSGWVCQCVCGQQEWVLLSTLRRTKSPHCQHYWSKDVARYYNQYVQNAKSADLAFDLPRHTFARLVYQSCFYCSEPPESERYGTSESYSLLGRRKLEEGYTKENSVPVCGKCGNLKNSMDEEDFILYVQNLYSTMRGKLWKVTDETWR